MSEQSIRPNLFIVGAMKSGTTSLHEYLDTHPDVFMSAEKEPGFFVPELWRDRGEARYLELFRAGQGLRYRGESSTHYAKRPTYPGVAARMHRFAPDARLIYIMRNPVERTISHYWHAVRDVHLSREHRAIVAALRANPAYTAYSDYAMQLEAFLEVFPREQLYCLTLEALLADPAAVLAGLFDWLGLPPHQLPELRAHNAAPERSARVAGRGFLNWVRYSSWWTPFSAIVPAALRSAANRLAYREVEPRLTAAERTAVENVLRDEFAYPDRVQALERLLGRTFAEWRT